VDQLSVVSPKEAKVATILRKEQMCRHWDTVRQCPGPARLALFLCPWLAGFLLTWNSPLTCMFHLLPAQAGSCLWEEGLKKKHYGF